MVVEEFVYHRTTEKTPRAERNEEVQLVQLLQLLQVQLQKPNILGLAACLQISILTVLFHRTGLKKTGL